MIAGKYEDKGSSREAPWTQERICEELSHLCSKINASDEVRTSSKAICRRAYELDLKKGRCVRSFIAAGLYLAVRKHSAPITLRDYLAKIEANPQQRKKITNYYRTIFDELSPSLPVADPSIFVMNISRKMNVSSDTIQRSIAILDEIKRQHREVAGRNPLAIAAAAVYLASLQIGDKLTQKDLAIATNLTEASVRSGVNALSESISCYPRAPLA